MSSSSRKKDRKSKGEWSLKKVRVGDVVDVKDAKGQWHEGRVHDTDQSNKCVEVYFHGMDIPTGQWSDKESVAPHRTHTTDAWREQLMKREAAFAQAYLQDERGGQGWVKLKVLDAKTSANGRIVSLENPDNGEPMHVDVMAEYLRDVRLHRIRPQPQKPSKEKAKQLAKAEQAAREAAQQQAKGTLQTEIERRGVIKGRKPEDLEPGDDDSGAGGETLWFSAPFSVRHLESRGGFVEDLSRFFPAPASPDEPGAFQRAAEELSRAILAPAEAVRSLHLYHAEKRHQAQAAVVAGMADPAEWLKFAASDQAELVSRRLRGEAVPTSHAAWLQGEKKRKKQQRNRRPRPQRKRQKGERNEHRVKRRKTTCLK